MFSVLVALCWSCPFQPRFWLSARKVVPLQKISNMNNEITPISEGVANQLIDALTSALEDSTASFERLAEEIEGLRNAWEQNTVLQLQSNVMKWAIRYNKLPRICRPVCLYYFKKWARRYNAVVCFLYPAVEGAPLPVEELINAA